MTYDYDYRAPTPPPTPPHFKHKHALPHHSSSKHSPVRAYDISCFLDPAYASGSSCSQSSSSPSSAYIDRHGDLHDPDYRPFAHGPAGTRNRAHGGGINVDTPSDDDESDGSETERVHRHTRLTTYPHLQRHQDRGRSESGSRTRHPSPRRYVPYYEPPYATTGLSSSPEEDDATATASNWMGHYGNNVRIRRADEEENPFEDGFGYEDEDAERKGRRLLKTRRFSRREKRKSKEESRDLEKREVARTPTPYHFDLDEEPEEGAQDLIPTQPEWTPTCTQSIRRQWQSVSLSLRFSIFRARRRLRGKLLNK
ncbi:hypothetical protein OE88DRAFT_1739332 [Heliocybe sulcata]|uniref:Uncharacterized protein n=1 Tax=Heliocybe sulcata TaxID=5364 RepID=A0A5C3MPC1_9AGAM|nr:hypothetical protein OE88DRAFT_1739332 [Heliocybe sulcata]